MQQFNAETFRDVFGLTILGSWFTKGNLSNKIERASYMAKDAGELAATIGAVISFLGIFFEIISCAFRSDQGAFLKKVV